MDFNYRLRSSIIIAMVVLTTIPNVSKAQGRFSQPSEFNTLYQYIPLQRGQSCYDSHNGIDNFCDVIIVTNASNWGVKSYRIKVGDNYFNTIIKGKLSFSEGPDDPRIIRMKFTLSLDLSDLFLLARKKIHQTLESMSGCDEYYLGKDLSVYENNVAAAMSFEVNFEKWTCGDIKTILGRESMGGNFMARVEKEKDEVILTSKVHIDRPSGFIANAFLNLNDLFSLFGLQLFDLDLNFPTVSSPLLSNIHSSGFTFSGSRWNASSSNVCPGFIPLATLELDFNRDIRRADAFEGIVSGDFAESLINEINKSVTSSGGVLPKRIRAGSRTRRSHISAENSHFLYYCDCEEVNC